jgi:hypothetical protein
MKAPASVLPPIPEASVQRAGLAYLKMHGIVMFRNNSRVFDVTGKGGKRRPMRAGLGQGSSDAIGIVPPEGRAIACEFKRPGEHPTAGQLAWLNLVNDAGGIGIWASDLKALEILVANLEWCRKHGSRLVVRFLGKSSAFTYVSQVEE